MIKKNDRLVAIGVVAIVAMLLFGVIIIRERDAQFERYALANDCEWFYQGTAYGDDRDFICK